MEEAFGSTTAAGSAMPLRDGDATAGAGGRATTEAGQVLRINPELCDIHELNPRAGVIFDPLGNVPLIDSIREQGQQVPVIVRPSKIVGRYEIVAGTRRFGAVRYLQLSDPDVLLLTEVRDLDDRSAWIVAEVENENRKDISEYERAKNWEGAHTSLFDGNQNAQAKALGVDKSVVSRMLSLARLPDEIVRLVPRPELLRVRFAEQLAPALRDREKRSQILTYAATLAEHGQKYAPAELARQLLLPGQEAEEFRPIKIPAGRYDGQAVWQRKSNGACHLLIRPPAADLTTKDRKALFEAVMARVKAHIEGR
jgi:ParB family transcriptional regulator, chromosome partitioning protein